MAKTIQIFASPAPANIEPVESTVEKFIPKDGGVFTKIMSFSFGPFSTADLLQILLTMLICFLLLKYLIKYVKTILCKTKLDKGLQGFIISILKGLIYIFGAITILEAFGMPVTQMVAIISVLGLAISLSIQNFMTNLMSGFTILASKPYVVDDYIEVDGGAAGTVIKIGLLYTEFKSVDEKTLYIPNSLMSSGKIINYSRSKTRKIDMLLGVDYESDIELVKSLILGIVEKDKRVLKEPKPVVRLKNFGPHALEMMIRFTVKSPDYIEVMLDVNERILAVFRQNNIIIPHPQLEVKLKP